MRHPQVLLGLRLVLQLRQLLQPLPVGCGRGELVLVSVPLPELGSRVVVLSIWFLCHVTQKDRAMPRLNIRPSKLLEEKVGPSGDEAKHLDNPFPDCGPRREQEVVLQHPGAGLTTIP